MGLNQALFVPFCNHFIAQSDSTTAVVPTRSRLMKALSMFFLDMPINLQRKQSEDLKTTEAAVREAH